MLTDMLHVRCALGLNNKLNLIHSISLFALSSSRVLYVLYNVWITPCSPEPIFSAERVTQQIGAVISFVVMRRQ